MAMEQQLDAKMTFLKEKQEAKLKEGPPSKPETLNPEVIQILLDKARLPS